MTCPGPYDRRRRLNDWPQRVAYHVKRARYRRVRGQDDAHRWALALRALLWYFDPFTLTDTEKRHVNMPERPHATTADTFRDARVRVAAAREEEANAYNCADCCARWPDEEDKVVRDDWARFATHHADRAKRWWIRAVLALVAKCAVACGSGHVSTPTPDAEWHYCNLPDGGAPPEGFVCDWPDGAR